MAGGKARGVSGKRRGGKRIQRKTNLIVVLNSDPLKGFEAVLR